MLINHDSVRNSLWSIGYDVHLAIYVTIKERVRNQQRIDIMVVGPLNT